MGGEVKVGLEDEKAIIKLLIAIAEFQERIEGRVENLEDQPLEVMRIERPDLHRIASRL